MREFRTAPMLRWATVAGLGLWLTVSTALLTEWVVDPRSISLQTLASATFFVVLFGFAALSAWRRRLLVDSDGLTVLDRFDARYIPSEEVLGVEPEINYFPSYAICTRMGRIGFASFEFRRPRDLLRALDDLLRAPRLQKAVAISAATDSSLDMPLGRQRARRRRIARRRKF